jgi:hypothetical protein
MSINHESEEARKTSKYIHCKKTKMHVQSCALSRSCSKSRKDPFSSQGSSLQTIAAEHWSEYAPVDTDVRIAKLAGMLRNAASAVVEEERRGTTSAATATLCTKDDDMLVLLEG